ncbi:hypothetical protein SFRURICE_000273 [Spodoptera frugiperda]|nr:hypothetical protein SFRURICE_000273 [Spodoptera frugiperda]
MYQKVLLLSLFFTLTLAKDDFGFRYISRVYEDCQNADGFAQCLKKKAIMFFDRAARMETIPLVDGVDVVRSKGVTLQPITENEIEAVLPRSLNKDETLNEMLWDRIAAFANSRTVQLSLPKVSGDELNKGVEEGRGKMKKMMSMMMMGGAMKMAAMIPLAIAGLFVLAGKALIVSKVLLMILLLLLGLKMV